MTTNKTRQNVIDATERLLRTHGLARVTTRAIAREAGVAEGSLYHHFSDKAELLHAVVQYCMGDFRDALESLPLRVGQYTVRENLEHTLQAAFDFQFKIIPITCSLFADHALLARMREILSKHCIGPARSVEALAVYLQAEQRLGRVAAEISAQSAAELLLASSFHGALFDQFLARQVGPDTVRLRIHETVRTLLAGLAPRPPEETPIANDRKGAS